MGNFEILLNKEYAPILAALIAASTAIFTIIVTTCANAWVSGRAFKNQNHQKDKELKLEKLEQIHYLFDNWDVFIQQYTVLHLRSYKYPDQYQETKDYLWKEHGLERGEVQRYRVLLHLYFPHLANAHEDVIEAQLEVDAQCVNPKRNKPDADALYAAQNNFDLKSEEFKTMMRKEAQNILSN